MEEGEEGGFVQESGYKKIVNLGLSPGSSGIKSYHKAVLNLRQGVGFF